MINAQWQQNSSQGPKKNSVSSLYKTPKSLLHLGSGRTRKLSWGGADKRDRCLTIYTIKRTYIKLIVCKLNFLLLTHLEPFGRYWLCLYIFYANRSTEGWKSFYKLRRIWTRSKVKPNSLVSLVNRIWKKPSFWPFTKDLDNKNLIIGVKHIKMKISHERIINK